MGIGFVGLFVLSKVDYRIFKSYTGIMYLGIIILLVVTRLIGKTVLASVIINGEKEIESLRVVPGIIKNGRPLTMEEKQARDFIDYLNRYNINYKLNYCNIIP
jgi:C4-dicarboxylate transporter